MSRFFRFESIVVLMTVALVCGCAIKAMADPCNGKSPYTGHCGTEQTCESHGSSRSCASYVGHYFEDTDGIACITSTNSANCVESNDTMKCTCEWSCKIHWIWNTCVKDSERLDGSGNQICSTKRISISQSCDFGD